LCCVLVMVFGMKSDWITWVLWKIKQNGCVSTGTVARFNGHQAGPGAGTWSSVLISAPLCWALEIPHAQFSISQRKSSTVCLPFVPSSRERDQSKTVFTKHLLEPGRHRVSPHPCDLHHSSRDCGDAHLPKRSWWLSELSAVPGPLCK
jgi:hypothetical protein